MGTSKLAAKSKPKKKPRPKSMLDALFTSTQQRVLGLLFGQPDRMYFSRELIQLSRIGSGAVQRELAALAESGLVNTEVIGKQKYYQANKSSPIFSELRSITLKTVALVEPIKEALRGLKHPIELALIYGSIAKGTDKAGSDVDLLVVSDEITPEDLYKALEQVESMLSRKISPTLYTTEDFDKRLRSKNAFLTRLLAGEYMTLLGSVDAVS
jgi:predicted nucleotidyltransferase